jgi:hypothetical protein
MNTKLVILFIVLSISALIFVWGATNYVISYNDTPGADELFVRNSDVFAVPAVIATFAIMTIVPILVFVIVKSNKLRVVFIPISVIGIFLVFYGILQWIIANRI